MAPAQDELVELPSADTLTLLFRYGKSTTVLSVLPTKPFDEVKTLLLAALQSRNIKTLPGTTTPLPEDPEELEFGVLADKRDASKGWVPLAIREQEVTGPKGSKKKIGGAKSVLNESPAGAGLGDGAWVAYRVKKAPADVDMDQNTGDDSPDVNIEEDPGFDVVIPSYDEEPE